MKDLYYEIEENGYHIYDKNDPLFHIHQYEPYIPDKTKSYEENAKAQIEELLVEPEASNNSYGISNTEYDKLVEDIQQNTINEIVEGVSANE